MAQTLFVLSLVLLAVSIVLLLLAAMVTPSRNRWRKDYFAIRYGSSVDRMLAESTVDTEQLRSIRDGSRDGPVKAARELLRVEPVPLKPAAEFIRRL